MVDRDTEEQIQLDDIQGDILVGLQKEAEMFVGFAIEDPIRFKRFLSSIYLTTARETLVAEHRINMFRQNGGKGLLDIRGINIAFTFYGLKKRGVPELEKIKDSSFRVGLPQRSAELNDPPTGPGSV